jgi:hypothetical protein
VTHLHVKQRVPALAKPFIKVTGHRSDLESKRQQQLLNTRGIIVILGCNLTKYVKPCYLFTSIYVIFNNSFGCSDYIVLNTELERKDVEGSSYDLILSTILASA